MCPVVQALDEDGGVFWAWLRSQLVDVVRQKDLDALNTSLSAMVVEWRGPDGGLTPKVGTTLVVLWWVCVC